MRIAGERRGARERHRELLFERRSFLRTFHPDSLVILNIKESGLADFPSPVPGWVDEVTLHTDYFN